MTNHEQIQEIYEQIKYSTGSYDDDARSCAEILYGYCGYRKQITAKWEVIAQYGGLHVRCSNADCHRHLPFGTSPNQLQYCPFCGAKMEGELK